MKNFKIFSVLLILAAMVVPASSQQAVRLMPDQSEISIKGTSNLHDWEENVENFKVNLNLKFQENELIRCT
jgi:hypothetical protein